MNDTTSNPSCCFCVEISSRRFPAKFQEEYGPLASRICHETPEFVIFPSVSPLTAGHLLIVSRSHAHSFAELPRASRQDAQALVEGLAAHLQVVFARPAYIFEHGVSVDGGGACGVDHAHVHVLPLPQYLASAVQARVARDFPATAHDALSGVLDLVSAENHESYLLYGDSPAKLSVCVGRQVKSQYMRTVISEQIGSPRYDWKGLYNAEAFALSCKAGTEYAHA